MYRKDAGLQLKHRNVAFKAETVNDDGTFKGYASVFGNVDLGNEVVEAGAFTDSLKALKKSGDPLPVLWQHNAGIPIGGDENLLEDDKGLKADGFLILDIPEAQRAHKLMKRRVVKGLSIGYYVEDSSYNDKTGVLTLKKLDIREYSIVTFPMNTLANVEEVKQVVKGGKLPTLSEFEDILRDVGFSKTQAKAIAGHGLRKLLDQCEADGNTQKAVDLLAGFKLPELNF